MAMNHLINFVFQMMSWVYFLLKDVTTRNKTSKHFRLHSSLCFYGHKKGNNLLSRTIISFEIDCSVHSQTEDVVRVSGPVSWFGRQVQAVSRSREGDENAVCSIF